MRRIRQLGLFVDTLAMTGARPSQAARLRVEDLHDHPAKPKLMMPKSGKGGGRNRSAKKAERYSVPITVALSQRLKAAAAGRAADAPLLVRADGTPWGDDPSQHYRRDVREVLTAIGEDPDEVTLYSLRHSNIVRMLLKNIPIRLIASLAQHERQPDRTQLQPTTSPSIIPTISRAPGFCPSPRPPPTTSSRWCGDLRWPSARRSPCRSTIRAGSRCKTAIELRLQQTGAMSLTITDLEQAMAPASCTACADISTGASELLVAAFWAGT